MCCVCTTELAHGGLGFFPEGLFLGLGDGDEHVDAVVAAERGQSSRVHVALRVDHGLGDRRRHAHTIRTGSRQHQPRYTSHAEPTMTSAPKKKKKKKHKTPTTQLQHTQATRGEDIVLGGGEEKPCLGSDWVE
jgi:hypothetical protein